MMNAVEKLPLNNDWIALVFLSILSLLVVVKGLYSDRFKSLLGCFFSKNYFLDYAHDRQELLGLFHIILFLIQNMILGLFLYLISEETSFFFARKRISCLFEIRDFRDYLCWGSIRHCKRSIPIFSISENF